MLSVNRRYLWQIIDAGNGSRSEPFVCGPLELKHRLSNIYQTDEDQEKFYVLVLADVGLDIEPQQFVSRFPLYRVSSYINLDLETLTRPIVEASNG